MKKPLYLFFFLSKGSPESPLPNQDRRTNPCSFPYHSLDSLFFATQETQLIPPLKMKLTLNLCKTPLKRGDGIIINQEKSFSFMLQSHGYKITKNTTLTNGRDTNRSPKRNSRLHHLFFFFWFLLTFTLKRKPPPAKKMTKENFGSSSLLYLRSLPP